MEDGAHPGRPAPGFQRLLESAWISNVGDGIRNSALPLLAASLGQGASGVTVVAAAGTVPFALFGLVAGTLADRRARRPLIVRAHVMRAGVVAVMAVLVWTDAMSLLWATVGAFALGCGEAVADSAAPALLPELVPDSGLESANSSLQTAELVANDLVGPPVGSLLYSTAAAVPFAIDALSFLGAAVLARRIDHDEDWAAEPPTSTWRDDFREGIHTVWHNPVLRSTGAVVVALQLGHIAAIAPFVVYLTSRLGMGAAAYGIFLAAGSLGGLIGARTATRLIDRYGSHRTLVGVLAASMVAFGLLAIPHVVTVAIGFAGSFGAVIIGRIIVFSARQRSVPGRLLGRAQGALRSLIWGAATVGALVGGLLYDHVGPSAPYLFAAAIYAVATIAGRRSLGPVLSPSSTPVD